MTTKPTFLQQGEHNGRSTDVGLFPSSLPHCDVGALAKGGCPSDGVTLLNGIPQRGGGEKGESKINRPTTSHENTMIDTTQHDSVAGRDLATVANLQRGKCGAYTTI